MPIRSRSRFAFAAAVAGIVALFFALRLQRLDADPPVTDSGRWERWELVAEPTAKAHEARNWALFGAWKVAESDNYGFWRPQSPVWVYPLAGFLRVFGTDYPQLRIFATLFASLGLAGAMAFAAERRRSLAVVVGLTAATTSTAVFFDRSGILEPVVAGFLALLVYGLYRAQSDVRWLALAVVAQLAAFFTKQAGAIGLPCAVVFGVRALVLAWRREGPSRAHARLALVGIGLAAVAFLVVVTRPEYTRTALRNYAHLMHGSLRAPEAADGGLALARVFDGSRWTAAFVKFPFHVSLAALELGRLAVRRARGHRLDAWEGLAVLWFVSTWGALLVVRAAEGRFWTTLILPASLLAASFLDACARVLAEHGSARLRPAFLGATLSVFAVGNLVPVLQWRANATYSLRDASHALAKNVGGHDEATVIGLWAAPVVFPTPYRHFYVKSEFNSTKANLAKLGVTHLLFLKGKDPTADIVRRRFPDLLEGRQAQRFPSVMGRGMTLYPLPRKLGAPAGSPISRLEPPAAALAGF